MSSRMSQRSVYLVTAAIVASMVGGFALAQMSIGGTNTSYQGSQTTTVSAVPGLTWLNTTLSEVNATAPAFTSCPVTAACNVSTSGYTVCAGGFTGLLTCGQGHFVEQVVISVSTSIPFTTSSVALTMYVTGASGTVVGPISYFTEGFPITPPTSAENIVLDFDIGASAPGAVTAVTVLAAT